MEDKWDHKTVVSKFSLITKKELKKGWKVYAAKFCIAAAGVCDINTRAPLAYLLRDQLIHTDEVDANADEYPDLDHELIARQPIVHKDHLAVDVDKLKRGGGEEECG